MKTHLSFITAFFALVLNVSLLQAAPLDTASDTTDRYVIDYVKIEQFDGSQLVGKKLASYTIETIATENGVIRLHNILTENAPAPASELYIINGRQVSETTYIIDGRQVSKETFSKLNPSTIRSININKNATGDSRATAVISVETKK